MKLTVFLIKITGFYFLAPTDFSAVWSQLSPKCVEKGRFSNSVFSDDSDLFPALNGKGEVIEKMFPFHPLLSYSEGKIAYGKDLLNRIPIKIKFQGDFLFILSRAVDNFHMLQALHAALCHF